MKKQLLIIAILSIALTQSLPAMDRRWGASRQGYSFCEIISQFCGCFCGCLRGCLRGCHKNTGHDSNEHDLSGWDASDVSEESTEAEERQYPRGARIEERPPEERNLFENEQGVPPILATMLDTLYRIRAREREEQLERERDQHEDNN